MSTVTLLKKYKKPNNYYCPSQWPTEFPIHFLAWGGRGMPHDYIRSIGLNIIVYFMVIGWQVQCLKTFL